MFQNFTTYLIVDQGKFSYIPNIFLTEYTWEKQTLHTKMKQGMKANYKDTILRFSLAEMAWM